MVCDAGRVNKGGNYRRWRSCVPVHIVGCCVVLHAFLIWQDRAIVLSVLWFKSLCDAYSNIEGRGRSLPMNCACTQDASLEVVHAGRKLLFVSQRVVVETLLVNCGCEGGARERDCLWPHLSPGPIS